MSDEKMTPEEIIAKAVFDIQFEDHMRAVPSVEPPYSIFSREARRSIAALASHGYVIVPKEPTEAMIEAGWGEWTWAGEDADSSPDESYRAMINAATPSKTPAPR